jgi:ceramide glucosyltransferase
MARRERTPGGRARGRTSRALLAVAAVGHAALAVELACLWHVRRRRLPPPAGRPSVSLLKPLKKIVPELERNLESHLAQDYEGDVELVLGVGPGDPAKPAADAFAALHPGRVRVVVHDERAGLNPKVNQLIALTRASRGEVIVSTDATLRVRPGWLAETVAALELPGVGLATHLPTGGCARTVAAAWDGQVLATFVSPNVALAATIGMDQIVGKSLAVRRDVLDRIGGWEPVKDVLSDDKLLGELLATLRLRSYVCATPVVEVLVDRSLREFWERNTRWSMTRFRVLWPGAFVEPLLNPTVFAVAATALSPRRAPWLAASAVASVALARACATITGGSTAHVALFPLQQLAFAAVWLRGATLRKVTWQGHRLRVGARSRLTAL